MPRVYVLNSPLRGLQPITVSMQDCNSAGCQVIVPS